MIFFPVIMDYCHKSNNLYNHANYVIRQSFTQKDENGNNIGKYIIYKEIDKILKADLEYPDYKVNDHLHKASRKNSQFLPRVFN